MLSRRAFVQRSSLIALAPAVPGFLARSLRAAQPAVDSRILIVIHLDGGNDGINTVVPFADEAYGKHRKELKLPVERLIKVNDRLALHPSMRGAAELLDSGRLAIVQGVGYPNPSRSHFQSTTIWNTARFSEDQQSSFGWAGLALDSASQGPGPDALFVGEGKLPLALRGRRSVASSMLPNEAFALPPSLQGHDVINGRPSGSDLNAFVRRTLVDTYLAADKVSDLTRNSPPDGKYPKTQLGDTLELIARLIKAELPTRVYYATQPGFDTHGVQLPAHARLLSEFADATKALLDDLEAAGLGNRAVVLAFSEFGRRVEENASLGTDHGTAGPVFIAGTSVRPGVVGSAPDFNDLQDGDLKVEIDFRQVYRTLLENWLDIAAESALGGKFNPLPLIA